MATATTTDATRPPSTETTTSSRTVRPASIPTAHGHRLGDERQPHREGEGQGERRQQVLTENGFPGERPTVRAGVDGRRQSASQRREHVAAEPDGGGHHDQQRRIPAPRRIESDQHRPRRKARHRIERERGEALSGRAERRPEQRDEPSDHTRSGRNCPRRAVSIAMVTARGYRPRGDRPRLTGRGSRVSPEDAPGTPVRSSGRGWRRASRPTPRASSTKLVGELTLGVVAGMHSCTDPVDAQSLGVVDDPTDAQGVDRTRRIVDADHADTDAEPPRNRS